jgi:cholesterol oxidase
VHRGQRVSPTHGPTISGAIDFTERPYDGEQVHMEDGGFPDVLGNWLRNNKARNFEDAVVNLGLGLVRDQLGEADKDEDARDPYRYLMPWFAQGRDYGEGQMRLKRAFWLFGPRRLHLDWDLGPSQRTFDKIVEGRTSGWPGRRAASPSSRRSGRPLAASRHPTPRRLRHGRPARGGA